MKNNKAAAILFFFMLLPPGGIFAQADAAAVRKLYGEGVQEYRQENYYRAIELYKEALHQSPAYLDPLRGLAEAYFMLGEYREALHWCEEALRYDKNSLVLKTLKARIYIGLGEYGPAENLFREVLAVEPYNFEAQFGMAELDIVRGRTVQARLWYEKAMDLQPGNRRAILSLALVYEAAGRLEKAEELVKLALHHYPANYMVQYLAGKHYMSRGKLAKAEMHAKKALALKHHFPEATLLVSTIYLRQGNFENVVKTVEELIKTHGDNHLLWYTLGAAYENTGSIVKSLNAYSRVLRIRPDDEIARIAVENLVTREYGPEAPERTRLGEYHFQKGRTLQSRNYYQPALEEYRRGLLLAPFSKEGRVLQAEVFKAFGYYEKYLSELLILENEGLADNRVRDEIEIYTSFLDDEVSDRWGVRQYPSPLGESGGGGDERRLLDRSKNQFPVLFFFDGNATKTEHPLSEEKIAAYFLRNLRGGEKIGPAAEEERPHRYTGFAEAFRLAREKNSDFFLVFSYRENGRAFSAECELYNSATGSSIRSYRVFRTGNDKVKNAVGKLSEYIDASLPLRGLLIDKKFDTAAINLGRTDGIEPEMQFRIVETAAVTINPENLKFSYPDDSILGTFTVTETDELISEGTLESAIFFDLINPGDTVLPAPEVTEEDPEEQTEGVQEEEQQEEEQMRRTKNIDLYREILKIQ
jgi:tetratricopeptide (TPR) repeat protein